MWHLNKLLLTYLLTIFKEKFETLNYVFIILLIFHENISGGYYIRRAINTHNKDFHGVIRKPITWKYLISRVVWAMISPLGKSTLVISKSKELCEIVRYPYLDISGLQNWGKNKSNDNL